MHANTQSRNRSNELDSIAAVNRRQSQRIISNKSHDRKRQILNALSATETDWNSFSWQMANRIRDVGALHRIFPLTQKRFAEIETVGNKYRWAISPYYLSLMDPNNILDPVGLMAIPSILELEERGETDPMDEKYTHPAPLVTRRYPDRLILNVTNSCGMFCRFCQRKRNIGDQDSVNETGFQESIDFIEENTNIRDVLITGGDPLTLPTDYLDMVLGKLRAIRHVEVIRIGTRIPVTIPQRVDAALTDVLKKYHPLFMNVHFNHPNEITEDSARACAMLADAGIPLGNQMVLLNGVNNDRNTVLALNKELLKCRVRPYYIFFAKNIQGATHFNCGLDEGLDILDFLRGNVSGLAIPTFIVNAPHGFGKVPILSKNYELDGGMVELTTWEQRKIEFKNPKRKTIAEQYELISN
jgi:lysine 2,3-aminomutase